MTELSLLDQESKMEMIPEWLTRTRKRRIRRKRNICLGHLHYRLHQMEVLVRSQPDSHRSTCDYDRWGGGTWYADDQTPFCRWHQTCHQLEVEYIRNPRDVNLFCFAIDGDWMSCME